MSHQLQLPRQQEGPLGPPFSSPIPLSVRSLPVSFPALQHLAEPARGSLGLSAPLTLFQTARIKVSVSDEKSDPTDSPHWLDRRKVGVSVHACM